MMKLRPTGTIGKSIAMMEYCATGAQVGARFRNLKTKKGSENTNGR
jgi:hypothetical protein